MFIVDNFVNEEALIAAFSSARHSDKIEELLDLIESNTAKFGLPSNFSAQAFTFNNINDVRLIHFARNELNPHISILELVENADEYIKNPIALNAFHRQGYGNSANEKWTGLDGHSEYIVRIENGKYQFIDDLNDSEQAINAGTYNFAPPHEDLHLDLDVYPWIYFGNSPSDTSTLQNRSDLFFSLATGWNYLAQQWSTAEAFSDPTPVTGDELPNRLVGLDERDEIFGFDGNDTLIGSAGADRLNGGSGSDTADYTNSRNGILLNLSLGYGYRGDAGQDNLREVLSRIENILGTNYADVIVGDDGPNDLRGQSGIDVISGLGGNDTIFGGFQDDEIFGGTGADWIAGESGQDTLYGGNENDTLFGGAGSDELRGEDGNDWIAGENHSDTIFGGAGDDEIYGGSWDDEIYGGLDNDTLKGEEDNDTLYGGTGNDWLFGDEGSDVLYGGPGSDIIDGGSGLYDTVHFGRNRSSYSVNQKSSSGFELEDLDSGDIDTVTATEWIKFSDTGIERLVDYFAWWDGIHSPNPDPDPDPTPEPVPDPGPDTDGSSESLLSVQIVNQTIDVGTSIRLSDLFPQSGWVDNDGVEDIVAVSVADRTIGGGFLEVAGVRAQDGIVYEFPLFDLPNWRFVAGPDATTDEIGFNIIQTNGDYSPRLVPGAIVTSVIPDESPPGPQPGPDADPPETSGGSNLAVLDFSSTATGASSGGEVEVTYIVKNIGDERSARGKADIVLASSADLQSGRRLGDDFNISELNPGETRTYTKTVDVPISGNGNYYLGVDVRSVSLGHNRIESDDTASIPFQIAPGLSGDPDLRAVLTDPDEPFVQGTPKNIHFTVSTNGNGSPVYDYQVVLSRDRTASSDDIVLLDERSDRGLGHIGTHSYNAAITVPDYVDDGIYYLIAAADPYSKIAETKEYNNNEDDRILVVSRAPDDNDLFNFVGSHITLEADTTEVRTSFKFSAFGYMDSVDDPIATPDAGPSPLLGVELYISSDNIFDSKDLAFYQTTDVIEQPTGEILGISVNLSLPQWIDAGDYYIFGKFDPDNEYDEDFEFDNVTAPTNLTIVNNLTRTVSAGADIVDLVEGDSDAVNILDNDTTDIAQAMIVLRFEGDYVPENGSFSGQTASGLRYQIARDGTLQLDASSLSRDIAPDEVITETFRYELRALGDGTSDLGEVTISLRDPANPNASKVTGDVSAQLSEDDAGTAGSISITSPIDPSATFAGSTASGTYGTVEVNAAGDQWTYTPGFLAQFLDDGTQVEDNIIITASNGTTRELKITLLGLDDPSVFFGQTSFELSPADQVVSGTLSVADIDKSDTVKLLPDLATGKYGTFQLDDLGNWSYNLSLQGVPSLAVPGDSLETFIVAADDGNTIALTIDVLGLTPPTFTAGADTFSLPALGGTFDALSGDDSLSYTGANSGGVAAIDGGPGKDTVDFSGFGSAVWADLAYPGAHAWTRDGENLSGGQWRELAGLYNVENLTGTGFDDSLGGDAGDNMLLGGAGDDTVFGRGGNNVLNGGNGNDILHADGNTENAIHRVSVASDGSQANDGSPNHTNSAGGPSVNATGRYVAFTSAATNLVAGDTNNANDIFVHDRLTLTTERVSLANDGSELADPAGFGADDAVISGDGRYIAFSSGAGNLVDGDTNGFLDIFVRDRMSNTTEKITAGVAGAQTDANSFTPSISADGRYVAFESLASNLVSNDQNGVIDSFVFDRDTQTTTLVSRASDGTRGNGHSSQPVISDDGQFVAFWSDATNLVSGDNNGVRDVFLHDRIAGTTERISTAADGTQANGYGSESVSISGDGRFVAFSSSASNLVANDTNNAQDIFVYDRISRTIERVSVGYSGAEANGFSYAPSLSADGRHVAFQSHASNLTDGDTNDVQDVFVFDRQTQTTQRISTPNGSAEANGSLFGNAGNPSISANGMFIAFGGDASNFIANDGNGTTDVFLRNSRFAATGNDTLQGGDGTDWARFSSALSDYSFRFFDGHIEVTGDGIDMVSSDVEWLRFSDIDLEYSEVQGMTIGVETEAIGDYKLVARSGAYFVVDSTDTWTGVTQSTLPVGPDTFPGYTALHAEDDGAGGFKLLWLHTSGQHFLWSLDGDGNFLGLLPVSDSDLIGLESMFSADLNNDSSIGHFSTLVETDGEHDLLSHTSGQYLIRDTGNTEIPITLSGAPVGPDYFPGFTARQAEDDGAGGFKVLWANASGQHFLWSLDGSGNVLGIQPVGGDELIGLETMFNADLNNDSSIGHFSTLVETDGEHDLLSHSSGQYLIRDTGNTEIPITLSGAPVGPEYFPGFTARQAEDDGVGGFKMLWANASDQHFLWSLDGNGNVLGIQPVGSGDLIGLETMFDADLNNDTMIGHFSTVIETDGDHDLLSHSSGQYLIRDTGNTEIPVTQSGAPIGPDTFPGYSALHAEEDGAGGFKVLWMNTTGQHFLWSLDGTGSFTGLQPVAGGDLIGLETMFGADLNNDNGVGHFSAVVEADGDHDLLSHSSGQYRIRDASNTEIPVTQSGAPIGPDTFAGYSAVHAEDDGIGGFKMLWNHVSGQHFVWTLDGAGNFLAVEHIPQANLIDIEDAFEFDLDNNGVVGNPPALTQLVDEYQPLEAENPGAAPQDDGTLFADDTPFI